MSNDRTSLVRYDAACRAVAEAKTVDEAKDIRDKAIAMQAYARQAKNRDLKADALEIRMRATRRLDQLRQAQKDTVGLNEGGRPSKTGLANNPVLPTLASQGIDKNLAHNARKLGALSEEDFERAVGEARSALNDVVKNALRADAKEARHAERMAKLVEVSRANAPLPSDRRYPVIYADPPWKFRVHEGADNEWAAEQHYPTMELEDICALPVADTVATPDAVLFLWTPASNLLEALRVVDAWGFEYVTCAVWVKASGVLGFGHWVRTDHELLLVARRGSIPCPLPADRPSSVIQAPRREHSRKPDEAYEVIERMYPDLPRIELFARNARAGWAAWGNQTEKFDVTAPPVLNRAGGRP
jgi:N6-adenosine-specific RNA methylase IME4